MTLRKPDLDMEPRPPSAVTAKAMESLKGMKFMMRKQEATRLEAHNARREALEASKPADAAASTGGKSTGNVRILRLEDLPTTSAPSIRSRPSFGDYVKVAPVIVPPPAPSHEEVPARGGGKRGGKDGAKAARFYLPEGDRAPKLPRGLTEKGTRTEQPEGGAEGGDEDDEDAGGEPEWAAITRFEHAARRPPRAERPAAAAPTRRDYTNDDDDEE